jgi:hypothetical protein
MDDTNNSLSVMEEIMSQVIADVAEYAATVHCRCGVPIVEKNSVSELPEWGS